MTFEEISRKVIHRKKRNVYMDITNVIALLSGVALFLFGMQLMGEGLKKVAGSKLEMILYKLSSTPLKGVLFGTGVTAVIQSSSATSVMVVGFVNSGMMKVKQAIGIIMGAIIGTSITGWILCLNSISGSGWVRLLSSTTITGIVSIIGTILIMASKNQTKRHIGDILMGFAILMVGMNMMSSAVSPLRDNEAFINFLTKFSNPFIGILFGVLLTSILQSASASVGILQVMAGSGMINFSVAFPLIMGIAVGAAVPVLISAIGANTNGKRTAFIYLLIDLLGAIIWAAVFYTCNAIFHFTFMDLTMNTVNIALMNTLFRLATVIVLFPLINVLEKLICVIIKDKPVDEELREMDCLEERFIEHPTLAIEQSKNMLKDMALKANKNLHRAIRLLDEYKEETFVKVQKTEDIIDRYEDKLGTYLVKITQRELTHGQNQEISILLHTINDFERIADHAVNISEAALEISEKGIVFSKEAQHELEVLRTAVLDIVQLVISVFEKEDKNQAYRIEPLEELIDNFCEEIKMNHIQRVQSGECSLNQGFVFNDLLTDYERIADHCSNVAVAIIELQSDSFETHEYLNNLLASKTENFNTYLAEYKKKYVI